MEQSKNIDTLETYKEATPRRRRSPRCSVVRVASLLGVRRTPTTRSAAGARQQLLPAAVASTPPLKARAIARSTIAAQRREVAVMAATPLPATVAITRSATTARWQEVLVVAVTPSPAAVAASPPSTAGVITRSATAARRREAEVDACTCDSDLARYTEFLREEEERLVEH